MVNQDYLVDKVRLIKTAKRITTKDLSNELGINYNTLRNWLAYNLNLGEEKKEIIETYIEMERDVLNNGFFRDE